MGDSINLVKITADGQTECTVNPSMNLFPDSTNNLNRRREPLA